VSIGTAGRVGMAALLLLQCSRGAPGQAAGWAGGEAEGQVAAAGRGESQDPPRETALPDRGAAAEFLRHSDPADVGRALEGLAAVDPHVRAALAEFLGSLGLGLERLAERVDALAAVARDDRMPWVRAAAVDALARLDQAPAAAALAALIEDLPAAEQEPAAKALAGMLRGGPALEALVVAEHGRRARGAGRIAPAAFAELLAGLGSALAEAGDAALDPARHGALLAALAAPSDLERAGARAGVEAALARWVWLERADLARGFLDRAARAGFAGEALVVRAARIALGEEGDGAQARRLARTVGAKSRPPVGDSDRELVVRARLVEAAAELAVGNPQAGTAALAAARAQAHELVALRLERGGSGGRGSRADAEAAVEARRLAVLVDVWDLCLELARGRDAFDEPLRVRARDVHRGLLELHGVALELETSGVSGGFDDVLEGEYSPRRLLGLDERHAALPRARWLALQRELGRALALAAPHELPGFLDADESARADDPFADPERAALYRGLRLAEIELVQRRIADDPANRGLWARQLEFLREQVADDGSEGRLALLNYRTPASAALLLALDLRGDGDPAAGRGLARDMQSALADGRGTALWREWTLARLAMAIGAASTDLDEPTVAEAELDRAVTRLLALMRELEQRRAELAAGAGLPMLGSDPDAERRRVLEAQIELTRGFLSDAYVSLAVNANVRANDPERAVAHFERAFELRQGDFMVVLLACYRARVGRFDEARALLVDVHDAPPLHYNMACTYALLGETDRALEYLERTLESSVRSSGARARQREWARDDPDLASLRGHPRFEALTASQTTVPTDAK